MTEFPIYSFEEFTSRYDIKIPEKWQDIIDVVAPAVAGPWIAGGFLRRLFAGLPQESDIDIFCIAEFQRLELIERIKLAFPNFYIIEGEFNTSITLSFGEDKKPIKVQVMKIYASRSQDVIDNFDFTICQWVYDGTYLITGPYTIYDTLRKRLAIHKITFPISTARRILKYANQGYTICAGTLEEMFKWVVDDPQLLQQKAEYID